MKKFLSIILLTFLLNLNIGIANINAYSIVIKAPTEAQRKEVTLGDMFVYFADLYDGKIPKSYKYIDLKIKGINKDSKVYEALQKLVYVDKVQNQEVFINPNKKISLYILYSFTQKNFDVNLINPEFSYDLKTKKAHFYDLENLKGKIQVEGTKLTLDDSLNDVEYKKKIFLDVYKTLNTQTYYRDSIDKRKMLDEAIKGLAKGTGDKYTVYFPATKNKDFRDALSGEYEGIGAYVDMEEPGKFRIVSPIAGSPAEKAGLKGGDIVIKVDQKEIKETHSINEIVSWIKGPAGTDVVLTIKRGSRIFDITITRAKITIKEIEYKKIKYDTYLVKLKFFGNDISKEFKQTLEEIKKDKNVKKIIFDLRGNGGGYLDQVADMLSYFVKKGEKTVVTKYKSGEKAYYSKGYDLIDFSKYKIILLENSGTASASEIFIGTIKDYYSESTIIGEKSFGKGSVQTIRPFRDGSALKYTIAKWFTGKTKSGIDGIGIKPDIEIKMEKYGVEENKDTQLQKALRIR